MAEYTADDLFATPSKSSKPVSSNKEYTADDLFGDTPAAKEDAGGWETIAPPTKPTSFAGGARNILRTAAESAPSAAAGIAGFGAGMAAAAPVAAAVAPFTGPFAPVTAAAIEFGGGLGTAFIASGAAQKVTNMMHKAFAPDDYAAREAEKKQYPYGTFAAETLTGLAGMSPKTIPEVAGKLLTKPSVQRAVSGGLMGGIEAGSELATDGKIDPVKVAASMVGGAAMPGFNVAGKKLFEAGEGAVKSLRKSVHSTKAEPSQGPELPSIKTGATDVQQQTFIDQLKQTKAKNDAQAKVVQAAIRNNETDAIELHGPKHDDVRKAETTDTHTQGFLDENGNFLDRKQAWNRVKELGQVTADKPERPLEGLHSGDMRTAGDTNFDLFQTPKFVEDVPVTIDREMKRADGSVVGARLKRATGEISINPEHIYQQFTDKAWTKPKVEGVFPIAEDAFKTPQEWADFVLQHEVEHVKTPIAEGQTKAQYENQTNKFALETLARKKAIDTGKPVEAVEPAVKPIEEVKPDLTKTDPRDVKSEEEFKTIAQEIYDKHGEVEAIKFFQGYEEYKRTWLEPISETEKYTGINLRNKAANERIVHNNTSEIKELAGKEVDLEKLTYDIDKGATLTGKAKAVADKFRTLMDDLGKKALENGVIKGWHEDYVARNVVSEGAAPPNALKEFMQEMFGTGAVKGEGTKTTTKYGNKRTLKTREDLVAHIEGINGWLADKGLDYRFKLKTDNLAEIYKDYALSVEKAIENKNLVEALKQIRNVNGESLIKEINKDNPLPMGWKMMDEAQFAGYAVHPDMAPALKFVFDSGPKDLMKALGFISQLTKRLNVVGSLFHAKSMMEVMSSAGIPIWTPVKEAIVLPLVEKAIKAVTGKDLQLSAISKAVEQYRKGGVGDNVDKWIKESGLQLEVPEDVSKGVLTSAGKFADSMISKFGPKTRALEQTMSTVEKYTLGMFDKYTWDYLHTGGKIMVADAYLDKARMKAAAKGKPFDEAQQRKEIASFVNNSFGGLNWFDAATQTQNHFAKQMAMAAYSIEGRRALQVSLFAPDWTISTLRAFTDALPKGLNPSKWHPVEGVKGIMTPTTKADYARLYQFKTALTYLTLVNAINMMTANRPIWDNKDPTRIEWPDGTSMQAMKHAMEPYHWMSDPDKTLANKLGFIPKAAIVGIGGLEYASPQAQKLVDPSAAGRLTAVAKMALPFQVAAAGTAPPGEGAKRALLGTLGFPVYGATAEQRKAARSEREKLLKKAAKDYHIKAKEKGWEKP